MHCEDHGIVFNASLPLYKDAIRQKGSMRSNDNADDITSMMVGTVLSGFEYRAQKEKYDVYKLFKENEEKYQYTGFTNRAINKTQNVGYQNEFVIVIFIKNRKEYRKYYEPLNLVK